MSAKHTPEPWVSRLEEMGGYDCMTDAAHIIGPDGTNIATLDAKYYGQENCRPQPIEGAVLMEFNAARIVACVNEFAGVDEPTGHLARKEADLREALDALERMGRAYAALLVFASQGRLTAADLRAAEIEPLPLTWHTEDGAPCVDEPVLCKHGRAV